MIVVDTNVASELMRPAPAVKVREWVRMHSDGTLYTTSVTLAEILYGIERLPEGNRKEILRTTARDLFAAFADQVLSFDVPAATRYAGVVAGRERAGRPINGFDAQIASICLAHGATLATRNVKDFQGTGVELIDPWQLV